MCSSKPQSTHFWFDSAFLYPPVLLFEQMELCLSLLRSLFQGCGQLLSGLRRYLPLGASAGNKADLTWWTTSIEHISLFYEVEQSSAGPKLYSFHSFSLLSFCIMYSALHIMKRASVSDLSLLRYVLNKGWQWHRGHISSAYGLKNMHTFLSFTTFIRLQLPRPQFLHSFVTPHWTGSSGSGVVSALSSGPAAVSIQRRAVCCDRHSLLVCSKEGLWSSLDGDVWRASLIPPCLMLTPLNPTNSISSFVRDGIHKPFFEGSIFQECVHGLAVAWTRHSFPWIDGLVWHLSGHYSINFVEQIIDDYWLWKKNGVN